MVKLHKDVLKLLQQTVEWSEDIQQVNREEALQHQDDSPIMNRSKLNMHRKDLSQTSFNLSKNLSSSENFMIR